MIKLTVDRIEEGFAVCELENCSTTHIKLSTLPEGIHEGSILKIESDGSVTLDTTEENKRKEKLLKIQDNLFNQ